MADNIGRARDASRIDRTDSIPDRPVMQGPLSGRTRSRTVKSAGKKDVTPERHGNGPQRGRPIVPGSFSERGDSNPRALDLGPQRGRSKSVGEKKRKATESFEE